MDQPNQENHFESYHQPEQPQYGSQPPANAYNGNASFATASLVLGILSLLLMCCAPPLTFVLGGLGIIFSCLSKGKYARSGAAKAGIALSAGSVGIVTAFILIVMVVFTSTEKGSSFIRDYLDLLLSGDEVTYEEIYDFMDKYLNDSSGSHNSSGFYDNYDNGSGFDGGYDDYPGWDDDFGNYYYDQTPDAPGWKDSPYYDYDTVPGDSDTPEGEFI